MPKSARFNAGTSIDGISSTDEFFLPRGHGLAKIKLLSDRLEFFISG